MQLNLKQNAKSAPFRLECKTEYKNKSKKINIDYNKVSIHPINSK